MTRVPVTSSEEAARSEIYRLLARFWLREVDRDLLSRLGSSTLRNAFEEAGGVLPAGCDDATIERLAIDYCQLFVGPTDHLPPYQSVWSNGQFHGTPTESMRQFIDVIGYDADELPRGMMLDHLGVQLDIMGHLLLQISTWPVGADSRKSVLDLAHSFSSAHLDWPTDLLEAAAKRATTVFYRSAVLLTRDFLRSEVQACW